MVVKASGESDVNMLNNLKDCKIEKEVKNKWESVNERGVEKEKEEEIFKSLDEMTKSRIKEIEEKIVLEKEQEFKRRMIWLWMEF